MNRGNANPFGTEILATWQPTDLCGKSPNAIIITQSNADHTYPSASSGLVGFLMRAILAEMNWEQKAFTNVEKKNISMCVNNISSFLVCLNWGKFMQLKEIFPSHRKCTCLCWGCIFCLGVCCHLELVRHFCPAT